MAYFHWSAKESVPGLAFGDLTGRLHLDEDLVDRHVINVGGENDSVADTAAARVDETLHKLPNS